MARRKALCVRGIFPFGLTAFRAVPQAPPVKAFRSLDSATWSGLNMERSGVLKPRNEQIRGFPVRPGL